MLNKKDPILRRSIALIMIGVFLFYNVASASDYLRAAAFADRNSDLKPDTVIDTFGQLRRYADMKIAALGQMGYGALIFDRTHEGNQQMWIGLSPGASSKVGERHFYSRERASFIVKLSPGCFVGEPDKPYTEVQYNSVVTSGTRLASGDRYDHRPTVAALDREFAIFLRQVEAEVKAWNQIAKRRASRARYLSGESRKDLKANKEAPVSAVFVGLMCADKIHPATQAQMIQGMVDNDLKLAGQIPRSIDPRGERVAAYISGLPEEVRLGLSNLDQLISGGPTTSSVRVCAQLAQEGNIDVSEVTSIGLDGECFIDAHKALGIKMDNVYISQTRNTASTLIFELGQGNRAFLHDVGASAELTLDKIRPEQFKGKKIAEFGGIELTALMPDIDKALDMAKAAGCITVFDTVADNPRQWRDFRKIYGDTYLQVLLSKIDVFTPSLVEARQIMADFLYPEDEKKADREKGRITPEQLIAFFSGQGAKAIFLKAGEKGSYVKTTKDSVFKEDREFNIPIMRGFKPVSGTGTGDAFSGAVVYAIAHRWDARKTATFANAVGGMCVQYNGGTIGSETLVDALYYMERLRAQMLAEALINPATVKDASELFRQLARQGNERFTRQVVREEANVRRLNDHPGDVTLSPDLIEKADLTELEDGPGTSRLFRDAVEMHNRAVTSGITGTAEVEIPELRGSFMPKPAALMADI